MRRFRGECGRAWKSGGSEGRGSARAHSACAVSGRHPQAMLSLATTPPRWRDRRWRRGPRLAAAASPAAAGPRGRRPLGAPPPPCRLARARARPVAGASARGRRLRWRRVLGRHGHGNIMARGQFCKCRKTHKTCIKLAGKSRKTCKTHSERTMLYRNNLLFISATSFR